MVKPRDEVITEFNEQVNMNADELERWLENDESTQAGTGVGLDSARKIVAILRKNPKKKPELYEDEDIEHMRKVVSYNKRHLAQEGHLKDTKTPEELEHTKSTISLRNWGHDPLKTLDVGQTAGGAGNADSENEGGKETHATEQDANSKPAEDAKGTKAPRKGGSNLGDKRSREERENQEERGEAESAEVEGQDEEEVEEGDEEEEDDDEDYDDEDEEDSGDNDDAQEDEEIAEPKTKRTRRSKE